MPDSTKVHFVIIGYHLKSVFRKQSIVRQQQRHGDDGVDSGHEFNGGGRFRSAGGLEANPRPQHQIGGCVGGRRRHRPQSGLRRTLSGVLKVGE